MTMSESLGSGPQRPPLDSTLSGSELLRWYWLKDELVSFARVLGVRTTGSKDVLAARIAAELDGVGFEEPARSKPVAATQLKGRLTATTVIPRGQRCSQSVREWFVIQVGSTFGFDAAMRACRGGGRAAMVAGRRRRIRAGRATWASRNVAS